MHKTPMTLTFITKSNLPSYIDTENMADKQATGTETIDMTDK